LFVDRIVLKNLFVISIVDTPSQSAWDEEDVNPAKRSSWDLPSPSPSRSAGGSSTRDWKEGGGASQRSGNIARLVNKNLTTLDTLDLSV